MINHTVSKSIYNNLFKAFYYWTIALLSVLAIQACTMIVDGWKYFTKRFFVCRFGVSPVIREFKRKFNKRRKKEDAKVVA